VYDPEKWKPVFRKDHAPTKKLTLRLRIVELGE
jgi:ribosomal protein L44E